MKIQEVLHVLFNQKEITNSVYLYFSEKAFQILCVFLLTFDFNLNNFFFVKSEAEFKEFEPRVKYGWFHLKLYSKFQDLGRRSTETGFWRIWDAAQIH